MLDAGKGLSERDARELLGRAYERPVDGSVVG